MNGILAATTALFLQSVVLSAPAMAAPTYLTASGNVVLIESRDFMTEIPVKGDMAIGTKFSINAVFDLASAELYGSYPSVNYYRVPTSELSFSLGGFSAAISSSPISYQGLLSVADGSPGLAPDFFALTFIDLPLAGSGYPFDLGSGSYRSVLRFTAEDRTNDILESNELADISSLEDFPRYWFSYSLSNELKTVFVAGELTSISISSTPPGSAVPESKTWALFLLGFGALGLALRRGRAERALPSAC